MEWIANNHQMLLLMICFVFFMFDATVRFVILRFLMFGGACIALIYVVRYVSFQ